MVNYLVVKDKNYFSSSIHNRIKRSLLTDQDKHPG